MVRGGVDTLKQNFIKENYAKEKDLRMGWLAKYQAEDWERYVRESQAQDGHSVRTSVRVVGPLYGASDKVKPNEQTFSSKVYEEVERTHHLRRTGGVLMEQEDGRAESETAEMRPVTPDTKVDLYQGVSHEGQGRSAYLQARRTKAPEDKYTYPVLSSWQYGWRLPHQAGGSGGGGGGEHHGRSRIVQESFYRRHGDGRPTGVQQGALGPCRHRPVGLRE